MTEAHHIRMPLRAVDGAGLLVIVLLVASAVGLALATLLSPLPWEVVAFGDDAYYQLVVARNVARGHGFTFDGAHAAGGVQVAWPLLLGLLSRLPVMGWLVESVGLEAVAAGLGLLLHVATAELVYRLGLRHAPRVAALALGALYLSRPALLHEASNGQETALAMLVLVLWWRARDAGSGRTALGLALLLPWVRTDLLVFPLAALGVGFLARQPGEAPPWRELAACVTSLGLYLLGHQVWFGRPLPSSGFAIPWLFHDAFFATQPSFFEVVRRHWWFVRPLLLGGVWSTAGFVFGLAASWCLLGPLAWWRRAAPLLLVLAAAVVGASDVATPLAAALLLLGTAGVARSFWTDPGGRDALALWLGFLGLLVLHLPLRWYPRDYYFAPAALCGSVTLLPLARRWLQPEGLLALVPTGRRLRVFWIAVGLAALADWPRLEPRFPWQEEMSLAARHARAFTGDGAGIAGFNSGLLGFHHRGAVRNLDGVVDGASLEALRERRLAQWCRDEGMSFLLDSPRQVADVDPDRVAPHASGRRLGPRGAAELVPLVAFDLDGVGGHHPGTECQVLYGLGGELAWRPPAIELLAREARGDVFVVPLRGVDPARLVVVDGGRERPLSVAVAARAAELLVVRLPRGATLR